MTRDRTEENSEDLRVNMVAPLMESAVIRSQEWKRAALAVPRHVFIPSFFEDAPGSDGITRYQAVESGRILELAYQDRTWVTQLDYGETLPGSEAVTGVPTSSSTLPSVVLGMLEDLDVSDGMRVLEVGTGTGYSTALLCARLGDGLVTSVEHDSELSAAAGDRLASLGYRPRLVVGDGACGYADGAPYERVIATYSPSCVPGQWVEQSAPGAVVLVSLVGSWGAYGYVRLTVDSTTQASGRFIENGPSFMPSRETSHLIPGRNPGPLLRAALTARTETTPETPEIDPAVLDDSAFVWTAQLALPGVVRLSLERDGVFGRWFLHSDGSWAVVETDQAGVLQVYQGGPSVLWSALESVARSWRDAGSPRMDRYGLTVAEGRNTVWLDEPENSVGVLGP